jgi:hypothetical protein
VSNWSSICVIEGLLLPGFDKVVRVGKDTHKLARGVLGVGEVKQMLSRSLADCFGPDLCLFPMYVVRRVFNPAFSRIFWGVESVLGFRGGVGGVRRPPSFKIRPKTGFFSTFSLKSVFLRKIDC